MYGEHFWTREQILAANRPDGPALTFITRAELDAAGLTPDDVSPHVRVFDRPLAEWELPDDDQGDGK